MRKRTRNSSIKNNLIENELQTMIRVDLGVGFNGSDSHTKRKLEIKVKSK